MSIDHKDNADENAAHRDASSASSIHRLHLWQFQWVRDILVIAGVVFLFLVGYWLRSVATPLLIALTLAYLFEPLVEWMCKKRRWSRPMVVGGLIGILVIVLTPLAIIVVILVATQSINFVGSIPENTRRILDSASQLDERYREPIESAIGQSFAELAKVMEKPKTPSTESKDAEGKSKDQESTKSADVAEARTFPPPFVQWLRENTASIFQATLTTTGQAVAVISSIVGSVLYAGFLLFLIPFYFFYFSTSWPNIRRFVRTNLPPENFEREYVLVAKMDAAISGFVRGRIVISMIMGVMFAIGWAFCGVPYWLVLGLVTGILCAVPYLGGIGVPVAIVFLFLGQGNLPVDERMAWWGILLWPSLVFAMVQSFEGYVLTPYIAGKATDLGPVSILVAVLAGGVVMGIYGMLLAIPAMACAKILFTEIFLPRVQQWSRGQAEDILPINET